MGLTYSQSEVGSNWMLFTYISATPTNFILYLVYLVIHENVSVKNTMRFYESMTILGRSVLSSQKMHAI